MSLIEIWKSSPTQVREKHVGQVIAFAGAGKLRDASPASDEFREFLAHVPTPIIQRYSDECLSGKFEDNGLALQDVINQVGRRLGFQVEDGRYRGTTNAIGYDGLWRTPTGRSIVVEVKTTDAYRIDLDVVADYRKALVGKGYIATDTSSILIVVGRQDTGDLEAQIRGSRHAWDIRLISVDALLRLLRIKESVEGPATDRRIADLLIPREYTRVDGIIELAFAAAQEASDDDVLTDAEPQEKSPNVPATEKKFTPVSFHEACAARIGGHLHVDLLKRSKAVFSTPNEGLVVICAISREYENKDSKGYWFAFHPHQAQRLDDAPTAYISFACGSPDKLLLIPYPVFRPIVPTLNVTELEDRNYWHVQIFDEDGEMMLRPKKGNARVSLTEYLI